MATEQASLRNVSLASDHDKLRSVKMPYFESGSNVGERFAKSLDEDVGSTRAADLYR